MATATFPQVEDRSAYDRAVQHLRDARVLLPTFDELADPARIPASVKAALSDVDPDAAHPLNLFRVHWWNDAGRRASASVPEHVVLPASMTGVAAPIVVALGNRFPLIRAHKVLAAYACLVPRLVSGGFDPTRQRAVWPSTGNYCRGGVAISRLMNCRGVAVLPEEMSEERFRWLDAWVTTPDDVIRTPGSESNVAEIYRRSDELAADSRNVILNQFSDFGNYLGHWSCTGDAMKAIVEHLTARDRRRRLAAFVSATGSAGTIAAGDALKERYGARIVAAEPLECPTLLENGFGAHNIQGIGDRHVPLIHNVMNTDLVVAVSDRATDRLGVMFSSPDGRAWLSSERGVPPEILATLEAFGLSSICNVIAAIKTARWLGLGPEDLVLTVATDGAEMYGSERVRVMARDFPDGFGPDQAAEVYDRWMLRATTDHMMTLGEHDRRRIFNLGYFTWVEQRGVTTEAFVARRHPDFWQTLRERLPQWNAQIQEFNRRTGVSI